MRRVSGGVTGVRTELREHVVPTPVPAARAGGAAVQGPLALPASRAGALKPVARGVPVAGTSSRATAWRAVSRPLRCRVCLPWALVQRGGGPHARTPLPE